MIVDQLIAARPYEHGAADGFRAREAVDKSLDDAGQNVLIADALPPRLRFTDEPEDAGTAQVIPIRKRDALRAAWGAGEHPGSVEDDE